MKRSPVLSEPFGKAHARYTDQLKKAREQGDSSAISDKDLAEFFSAPAQTKLASLFGAAKPDALEDICQSLAWYLARTRRARYDFWQQPFPATSKTNDYVSREEVKRCLRLLRQELARADKTGDYSTVQKALERLPDVVYYGLIDRKYRQIDGLQLSFLVAPSPPSPLTAQAITAAFAHVPTFHNRPNNCALIDLAGDIAAICCRNGLRVTAISLDKARAVSPYQQVLGLVCRAISHPVQDGRDLARHGITAFKASVRFQIAQSDSNQGVRPRP